MSAAPQEQPLSALPWTLDAGWEKASWWSAIAIFSSEGTLVAHVASQRDIAVRNANLLVLRAAPTLLEACEQAEYWLNEHESSNYDLVRPTEILRVLRAAIAQAKGGA